MGGSGLRRPALQKYKPGTFLWLLFFQDWLRTLFETAIFQPMRRHFDGFVPLLSYSILTQGQGFMTRVAAKDAHFIGWLPTSTRFMKLERR